MGSLVMAGPLELYLPGLQVLRWTFAGETGPFETNIGIELPVDVMAASNWRLARIRRQHDGAAGHTRYYHLGNDLDRNCYRWPAAKYVARCRATIAAVRAVDPDARFVAFLRDFDLRADGARGNERGIDHAAAVLAGLPEINDISLQVYNDEPAGEGARLDLGWRRGVIDQFLGGLPRRAGRPVNVPVTEHAKARDLGARTLGREQKLANTSGMNGALVSADFCIAAVQRPTLMATFWHALGGGVWWDLFNPARGLAEPAPVYELFRLLRDHSAGQVLESRTIAAAPAGYAGGYDVSSAVLRDAASGRYTVWATNRSGAPAGPDIVLPGLAARALRWRMESVLAVPGSADQLRVERHRGDAMNATATAEGSFSVALPARAVVAIEIDTSVPSR